MRTVGPHIQVGLTRAPQHSRTFSSVVEAREGFASILARAGVGLDAQKPEKDRATDAAEQLVSIALVQPMFAKLRESGWAAEPFKANQAERTFRAMGDAEIARRMVKSGNWPLVERLAQGMRQRSQGHTPRDGSVQTGDGHGIDHIARQEALRKP